MMRKRLPKRSIWIKDEETGRWIFIKINLTDVQIHVPKEVVEERGRELETRVEKLPECEVYQDTLRLYACNEYGCKARLSKILEGATVIVGVI